MNAQRSPRRGPVAIAGSALALVAIVAIAAAVLASRPVGGGAPAPTARPSAPIPSAPAKPSATPSASPSTVPGAPASVDLDSPSGHEVSILIHGETGDIEGAVSGKPRDGMSVGWHKSIVRNLDAKTIELTWVGLPGDEVADLDISKANSGYAFTIVQMNPYPYTDAMGEDRVLVLSFDGPASADDISVEILDRTID